MSTPFRLVETEHDAASGSARRKRGPPPGTEADGRHVADRRVDTASGESRRDEFALPRQIGGQAQVLHGAAAAMGEVAAHGGDALRAGLDDGDEARALAAHICLHALARERIRARIRGPTAVSAMPSPWAPRRAMSNACVSPIAQRTDEKLDVARAAFDGRGNGAGDAPTRLRGEPCRDRNEARCRALPASRTMPPLPMRSGPTSNCGLTSATRNAPGAASSRAGPSALISEMKLTSAVIAPTGSGTVSRVRRRASRPSSETTRGSDLRLA